MSATPARNHITTVASAAPEIDYLTSLALALPVPTPSDAARLVRLLRPSPAAVTTPLKAAA